MFVFYILGRFNQHKRSYCKILLRTLLQHDGKEKYQPPMLFYCRISAVQECLVEHLARVFGGGKMLTRTSTRGSPCLPNDRFNLPLNSTRRLLPHISTLNFVPRLLCQMRGHPYAPVDKGRRLLQHDVDLVFSTVLHPELRRVCPGCSSTRRPSIFNTAPPIIEHFTTHILLP